MRHHIRWLGAATAVLLLTPGTPASAVETSPAPMLRAVELATRGDGGGVWAVNRRGQVIGSVGDGQGNSDPVRWTRYDTPVDVGFPRVGTYAINDHGDVLGEDYLWVDGDIRVLEHPDGKPWAHDVNNRRQIIGQLQAFQGQPFRAFRWQDGVFTEIEAPAGMIAYPIAINERGDVAGRLHNEAQTVQYGFLWHDGVLSVLRAPGGSGWVNPTALNDRGEVVGSYTVTGSTGARPFRWRGGQMTDLLAGGPGGGHAHAVNNAGVVVGDASGRPAVWREGRMIDIGTPGRTGAARAINDRGDVAATSTSAADVRVFRWRAGQMTWSDPYPAGTMVRLQGVDARGRIAGTVQDPDYSSHPIVWLG